MVNKYHPDGVIVRGLYWHYRGSYFEVLRVWKDNQSGKVMVAYRPYKRIAEPFITTEKSFTGVVKVFGEEKPRFKHLKVKGEGIERRLRE